MVDNPPNNSGSPTELQSLKEHLTPLVGDRAAAAPEAEKSTGKSAKKPKLQAVSDSNGNGAHGNGTVTAGEGNGASPLVKPDTPFSLDRFKSKRDKTLANVEVDPGPLPVSRITDVKDFVRVHHDEENYWTDEVCFISVPILGLRKEQLHIIDEELATATLEEAQIIRMRLALASKPDGKLFLAVVPSDNLDNVWNSTHMDAIRLAQKFWVMAVSKSKKGEEGYTTVHAKSQEHPLNCTLMEHIERTFDKQKRSIYPDGSKYGSSHPAFLRKIGADQDLT